MNEFLIKIEVAKMPKRGAPSLAHPLVNSYHYPLYREVTLNSDLLQTTICPFVS